MSWLRRIRASLLHSRPGDDVKALCQQAQIDDLIPIDELRSKYPRLSCCRRLQHGDRDRFPGAGQFERPAIVAFSLAFVGRLKLKRSAALA